MTRADLLTIAVGLLFAAAFVAAYLLLPSSP